MLRGLSQSSGVRLRRSATTSMVSVGYDALYAIDARGRVRACGKNDDGQLGTGDTTASLGVMRAVTGITNAVAVSAGQFCAACVPADGNLYTWGNGEHGRLGHGGEENEHVPRRVAGLGPVAGVSCGAGWIERRAGAHSG